MIRTKRVAIFLTIILPLVSLSFPAAAAVKAGGACNKSGLTTVVNSSLKLICLKSGKKLIWTKVAINNSKAASYSSADVEKAVSDSWAQWRANALKVTPKLLLKSQAGYSPDWEVVTKKAVT